MRCPNAYDNYNSGREHTSGEEWSSLNVHSLQDFQLRRQGFSLCVSEVITVKSYTLARVGLGLGGGEHLTSLCA